MSAGSILCHCMLPRDEVISPVGYDSPSNCGNPPVGWHFSKYAFGCAGFDFTDPLPFNEVFHLKDYKVSSACFTSHPLLGAHEHVMLIRASNKFSFTPGWFIVPLDPTCE